MTGQRSANDVFELFRQETGCDQFNEFVTKY